MKQFAREWMCMRERVTWHKQRQGVVSAETVVRRGDLQLSAAKGEWSCLSVHLIHERLGVVFISSTPPQGLVHLLAHSNMKAASNDHTKMTVAGRSQSRP